jgi:hypothetical protein
MSKPQAYITAPGSSRFHLSTAQPFPTPYDGTGTPWIDPFTSPIEIAMNEKTGEFFRVQSITPEPILSGSTPRAINFSVVDTALPLRTISIPLQLHATSKRNLILLRRQVVRSFRASNPELGIDYESESVRIPIYSGVFQDDGAYWNNEAFTNKHMMRGILTLQCGIGYRSTPVEFTLNTAFVNGTRRFPTEYGDYNKTVGDPAIYFFGFPRTGTTRLYIASSSLVNENTLTGSVVTSLTTWQTLSTPAVIGTRQMRVFALVQNASSNLRMRMSNSGIEPLTPEITPRAQAAIQIVDMGTITIVGGGGITLRIQFRSSNGSPTTGTVTRLMAVQYEQFGFVDTANTITLNSESEFPPSGFRGVIPRVFGGGIFALWETNNICDIEETASFFNGLIRPLRETI